MPDAQAIPGTDMDVKGLLRSIQARPAAMSADLAASQADLEKSTKAVADLRAKQQSERAPLVDKIKGKSEESLPEYNPKALPSFEHKGPDPDEMWNTISLLTAVAAMGGALTRQPLTAALNNFSAGVKGMVQGDEALYKRELQSFKLNFDKAKTENDELYKKAQQAREKHGTELQSLMNEMTTLAAEHQDQILSEMLKRGDIVSAQNLIVQRHKMMQKADSDVVRILETGEARKEASKDRLLIAGMAHEDRVAGREQRGEEFRQREARLREAQTAKIEKAKQAGATGGLKGKQLDSYIHNTANIDAIDEIVNSLAANPDAVGFKTVVPGILLNRADPDGTPLRASIANLTSMTIKDRAGTAQTVQEMKNIAPSIPRDGDDAQTVITKLRGMQKEMRRMNDTAFRLTTPGASGAPAGAAGTPLKNSKGWTLHHDGQGNKAYVGPNGEIEEVE